MMQATPARAGLPRNLIRASRVIGLLHGASMFAVATFIGTITNDVAGSLGVQNGVVTGANTLGGMCGSVLAVLIIVLRRGVPPRWVAVAIFMASAVGAGFVAVAGLKFAPGGIAWVYGGLCLASLALVSLTPVRPAVAASFASAKLDGTFTSRARAWSYGSIGTLALVVGGVATSPLGWRVATAIFAVWLATCGIMLLFFRQYPDPTEPEDRLDPWGLWTLIRAGEQRRMVIAVGATAFTAQLVYVSFEPFLSGPGRLGLRAPLAVGIGLAVVKLALVPLIVRQGKLADDRVRRSAQRAARYLAASALVAALSLVVESLAALLAVLLVAALLVELGNGPMGDAARTYGSRLGIEADAMTTVAQQVCYDLAGIVATLVQLPPFLASIQRIVTAGARLLSHPSTFGLVIVALIGAAVLVMRMTHGSEWRDDPNGRVVASQGPGEIRLNIGIHTRTHATYHLFATVRDSPVNLPEARDRGRFFVHSILPGGTADPRVPTLVLLVGAHRLRPLRRTEGRLFPGAIVPAVGIRQRSEDAVRGTQAEAELLRAGWGVWLGRPGAWRVERDPQTQGAMVLRSPELNATVVTRFQRHNA